MRSIKTNNYRKKKKQTSLKQMNKNEIKNFHIGSVHFLARFAFPPLSVSFTSVLVAPKLKNPLFIIFYFLKIIKNFEKPKLLNTNRHLQLQYYLIDNAIYLI